MYCMYVEVFVNKCYLYFQALSHKTLVMLLGTDPSKHPDQPIPTTNPKVTFAYLKHMWKSSNRVLYVFLIFAKLNFEIFASCLT